MEDMVKKFQMKFKKMRQEMDLWDELQARLLSQFRNACSIIERLKMILERKNYGSLKCVDGIEEAVLLKQMVSLETILSSSKKTMEEFYRIALSFEKMANDGRQLVKGVGSHQMQQRAGVKPNLVDCVDGLKMIHEMHSSEYRLKMSIISALPKIAIEHNFSDLGILQRLLVDPPNIARQEVQLIYDIIFAEEIC